MSLRLTSDASLTEAGVITVQVETDGTTKPTAYESKAFSKAERVYLEAAAITFGTKKIHMLFCSGDFEFHTNSKPPQAIFGQKSNVSA
jgi:hypothetical protein